MKKLMAVLATAVLAAAAPTMAQQTQQILMSTGSPTSCTATSPVTVTTAPGHTTMVTGFNAISYSLGGSDQVQVGTGATTVGVPKLSNLTISKLSDVCSGPLIMAMLSGSQLNTVTLYQLHSMANGTNIPVLTITLTNAYVTSWSLAASTASATGNGPQENFGFTYTNICVANTTITSNGTVGNTMSHCYNVQTNTAS
jgi:type VI protein secretion system component Hcp